METIRRRLTANSRTRSLLIYLRTFLVVALLVISGAATAQLSCPITCPGYTNDVHTAVPANSNTTYSVVGGSPSPAVTAAMNAAVGDLNSRSSSNGTGSTFSVGPGSTNFTITFDTTTTSPTCGGVSAVACNQGVSLSNAPSVLTGSSITIYLAATNCGGPCLDPSQPGYADAVQYLVEHELYHSEGVPDAVSNINTIMGPFSGTNASGNSTLTPSPCDDGHTQNSAICGICF